MEVAETPWMLRRRLDVS